MSDAGGRAELFPAIDLRYGRCVRLQQGEADRETVYDTDPFRVAESFAAQGARWLHVVDLDAAFGDGSNRTLIREIAARSGLRVQTGGGLRRDADLEEVLDGAVARAVIGTAAVENPDFVERAIARWGADRIAVGLDARGRTPALRGWREDSGQDLFDVARSLADRGARTVIYTDIARDGMLAGPNLEASSELAAECGVDVIVSGGVSRPEDLEAVATLSRANPAIVGVIVGKAIYEGRVTVADGLRRLAGPT